MRHTIIMLLLALLVSPVNGQNAAQEKAANLRAQLAENEAKQADLQMRLKSLDEEMKPENIASALAGIGSTKPEDMREQRRKQLEIERNGVQAQLNLLVTSHSRLETSIAQADAEAYRQSAAPAPPGSTADAVQPAGSTPARVRSRRMRRKRTRKARKVQHHADKSEARGQARLPDLELTQLVANDLA